MERKVYEYISKQTNDPIVERKICAISGTEFPIYQSDLDFYDKISPIFNGVKYKIPTPTLCPEERERRRLMFRNERKLYKRTCDATGKNIISLYQPEYKGKVYDQEYRRSDKWDAANYGRVFDFSKSFTEQFTNLFHEVPQINFVNVNNENCEYNNYLNDSKNCYFCAGSGSLEDSYFCKRTYEGKGLVDCCFCFRGENSYMNTACEGLFKSFYCIECKNITECYYCFVCENCKNCIGCVGLINKEFCIFNKQFSKEKYEILLKQLPLLTNNDYFLNKTTALRKDFGHLNQRTISSENCYGNDIKNSKNSIFGLELDNIEQSKYCREIFGSKNVQDFTNGAFSELLYEFHGFGRNYNVLFSTYTSKSKNMYYCAYCQNNCEYCFGCVALKNKQYCIFNKQYTKEEYETLVPKIIEHMQKTGERGEFFQPKVSPFAYNESVANEYYPLTQSEAQNRGYTRMKTDHPINIPSGAAIINAQNLPTNIIDIENDIVQKAIICEVSGRPFRFVKPEIEFYRKYGIPAPHKHPDIRYMERLTQRPHKSLSCRNCDKCGIEIISVYDKNYTFKVYCEECYKHEIYG